MPKGLQAHAAERIDLDDLTLGTRTFTQNSVAKQIETVVLDNQSRIRRGFRIELPDQASFPGRIVVHGGDAYDALGKKLLNEDQATVTRTVTLQGSTTNFYVEIEFIEGDGDVDARAFWDPTVDQGADVSGDALPDGQEFSDNVATTKVPDWKIVTPISTTAFARTANPNSTRIPLALLRTDGSNQITNVVNTNLTTEKPATTLLEVLSTTLIRVQDAQLFPATSDIVVGEGAGSQETATISTSVPGTGLITLTGALTNSHTPGEICRGSGGASPNIIVESEIGRYRRDEVGATPPNHEIDVKDKLFQGDEIHGDILSRGHGGVNDRSDVNIQSLKDRIDFMAAQLQELKWGIMNPYTSLTDAARTPPVNFPATPRYFDRAGGVAGSRFATVTVGTGTGSFGDFNGTTHLALQAAVDSLPSGGHVHIKAGTYTLGADLTLPAVPLIITGEGSATIINVTSANNVVVATTSDIEIRDLDFDGSAGADSVALSIANNPDHLRLENVEFTDARVDVVIVTTITTTTFKNCKWISSAQTLSLGFVTSTTALGNISGSFENCVFENGNAGAGSSCIDSSTNLAGLVNCYFLKCYFQSSGGVASVLAGTTTDNAIFDQCVFNGGAFFGWHIDVTSGALNFKIKDCQNLDSGNGLLDATEVDHVTVDGYINNNSVGAAAVQVTNCSNVKIRNIDVTVNSNLSLVNAAIKILCSSGTVSDVLIDGCTLKGDTGGGLRLTTGIITDLNGGSAIVGLEISNCYFETMETGIYFANTGAAAEYRGVVISGNKFIDEGVSTTVAVTQKIGVFATSISAKQDWLIRGNIFKNLNPANTNTVGGNTRYGVLIFGQLNERFVVSDNEIKGVGDLSNAQTFVAGIRIQELASGTVSGNVIQDVNGIDAAAISVADEGIGNIAAEVTVANNHASIIHSTTGDCAGFVAYNARNVAVTGNTFSRLTKDTFSVGKLGSGILFGDTLNCIKTTISGNTIDITSGPFMTGIGILSQTITDLSISGNTVLNTYSGIFLSPQAAGSCQRISISGNTVESTSTNGIGISINVNASITDAACNVIAIVGNNITNSGNDSKNVEVRSSKFLTINGNVMNNVGSHSSVGLFNISTTNVNRVLMIGNYLSITDDNVAGFNRNIKLNATTTHYVALANIMDRQGGTNGNTLDSGASGVPSNQGLVAANLIDLITNSDSDEHGITTVGNGQHGIVF